MANVGQFMSLEEVADMLGVTYQLIYKLVRAGELPAVRLGKLYRVSRKDLEQYLERNKSETSGGCCAVCGATYRSRHSLRQMCEVSGCDELICFDCWQNGRHRCPEHEPAANKKKHT